MSKSILKNTQGGFRFSLRNKILSVLGILLFSAVSFYTLLASNIFKDEKTRLLYDINHSIAINTASQLRSTVRQIGYQVRLFILSNILTKNSQMVLPKNFLREGNSEGILVYKKQGTHLQPLNLGGSYRAFQKMSSGGSSPERRAFSRLLLLGFGRRGSVFCFDKDRC